MRYYRFISDEEPTDEDLSDLMKEVAIDARIKYESAEKLFWENHTKIVKETIKEFAEVVKSEKAKTIFQS